MPEGGEDDGVNHHGHVRPVSGIDRVVNQVLEHQQDLHHKVQQVLSAGLVLGFEMLNVLTEMLRRHQSEQ